MIVVATDFSTSAAYALDVAAQLARDARVPLRIVSVYQQELLWGADGHERRLDDAAQVARDCGASPIVTELLFGDTASELVAFARRHRPHVIVMGTLGRTGLRQVMLGSVAERVIRAAPCPVLAVRYREQHRPLGLREALIAPRR